MSKRSVARIVLWIVAGTVFGIVTMPLFDTLARYPFLKAICEFITMPAVLVAVVLRTLGLVPHGDTGFVVIPISIITMWAFWGFFFGVFLEWLLGRKKGKAKWAEVVD